jgi:lipid II:glycine glycyltransferase (peptidoglycan interpeptide bridge formation enzyme)
MVDIALPTRRHDPSTVAAGSGEVSALRRDDAAWDAFVASSATPTHLQLTAWARAKAPNGWRSLRVVADGGSGPIGAQVLVRRLGPGPFGIGYAARGPIARRFDEASLGAFSAALRRAARAAYLTHVTVDPALEGEAPRDLFAATGWRRADPVQHDRTRLIDLRGPEQELWGALRATTRRYVNRAKRDGCTVGEGDGSDLDAFYAIMVETAERSGFIHRSREAYAAIHRSFAPGGRARFLFAYTPDGRPAAAKLLLSCGGHITQPYSGMTAAGAESRANYLLEWETIRRAKDEGQSVYDMWGLANPGISYFKAGFGGREAVYCGTWDLVTLPLLREALVRARRGYVWLARRRHGLAPQGMDATTRPHDPEAGSA